MDPDLPAVLLMGGGEGMGPVKKTAMALGEALYDKEAEKPIGQMVIICGRNKNLVSTLESFEWKIPVKDERGVMPPNSEVVAAPASAATTTSHGIEVAVEFKPAEHPVEPLDNDRPIQCPLSEPSILNVLMQVKGMQCVPGQHHTPKENKA